MEGLPCESLDPACGAADGSESSSRPDPGAVTQGHAAGRDRSRPGFKNSRSEQRCWGPALWGCRPPEWHSQADSHEHGFHQLLAGDRVAGTRLVGTS